MYLFVCFCFFKQKTAYEMRISDCSSDVFSSDLFWCVEAVYKDRDGVLSVASGYAGGSADTADYKTVCTGQTEHAEVIQIAYDPARTSFGKLLKIFFAVAHDPTQLNRQGNYVGAQYRSAIFYADEQQTKETGRASCRERVGQSV